MTPTRCVLSQLPHRCHTLQSLPHPYSRVCVSADRCPPAVQGCVPGATGSPRLQGLAPYERPLRQPLLPAPLARCSPGLPILEHRVCRSRFRPTEAGGFTRCHPLGDDSVSKYIWCVDVRSAPERARRARPRPSDLRRGGTSCHQPSSSPTMAVRPEVGEAAHGTVRPLPPRLLPGRLGCPRRCRVPRHRGDRPALPQVGKARSCRTSRPCLLVRRRPKRNRPEGRRRQSA